MSNELLDFHGINYSGKATPIIQLTENTIGIVVPKDAGRFVVKDGLLKYTTLLFEKTRQIEGDGSIMLPIIDVNEEWELLGKADQLSEEQWKGVVKEVDGVDKKGYQDYQVDRFKPFGHFGLYRFTTATESGHSLLRKHNLEKETTVLLKRKL